MKKARNLVIAIAAGGGLFIALALAEATTPGLDLGVTKWLLPTVLGGGLFRGLSGLSGNRRVELASDARKTELLAFTPQPGHGWVVIMRDKGSRRGAVGFDVVVDDQIVAQLLPKRFTVLSLSSGTHRLLVDMATQSGATAAPFETGINEHDVIMLAVRTKMGITSLSIRLDTVQDSPAIRAILARMQLVEPGQGG